MQKAEIVVDLSTIDCKDGFITGILYVQLGNQAFPQKKWTDNIAVVLTWWLDNIRAKEREFFFMQGAYSFLATHTQLQLLANYKLQTAAEVVLDDLHTSIITKAQEVVEYLQNQGYSQDDFTDLLTAYKRLKRDRLT